MSSCCGGNADTVLKAKQVLAMANGELPFVPEAGASGMDSGIVEPTMVRLEFIGPNKGAIGYMGRPSGTTYYGGDNVHDKYIDADPRDVEFLVSLGVWKVVQQPRQLRNPPPPVVAAAEVRHPTPADERPMLDLTDDMAHEQVVNAAAAKLARETRKR